MAQGVEATARSACELTPSDGRIDDRLARRGGLVECLRLPAWLHAAAVHARGVLYDRRWLPIARLSVPVVSVGNLSAGGAGKSPVTRWLARRLLREGWRPGVLSRGYKAEPDEPADEARELASRLPEVPQVQDADRVAGGAELERRGVDLVLLDDGFQHRRLHRDLDFVLVDALRPWGLPRPKGGGEPVRALLPRGLLREPPRALARANAIWITRVDCVPREVVDGLRVEIESYAPGLPIVESRHAPTRVQYVAHPGSSSSPAPQLDALRGRDVQLLSGIGNPEAFERTVEGLGARVVAHRRLPDHHRWTDADLAGLGELPVLATGKDAAKLGQLSSVRAGRPQVLELQVEIEVLAGGGPLSALLASLSSQTRRAREALHEGLHG